MTDPQDTNARFNALWDEIGAKQITLGAGEDAVQITIDSDLSFANVVNKLKQAAQDDADKGDPDLDTLSQHEKFTLKAAADQASALLEEALPKKLLRHFKPGRR